MPIVRQRSHPEGDVSEGIRLMDSQETQPHISNGSPAKDSNCGYSGPPVIKVERPTYSQVSFNKAFSYAEPEQVGLKESLKNTLRDSCPNRPCDAVYSILPVVKWLPKYRWKEDVLSDLIAGFTVAVMHIPQGMAYALLASVPPIVGIYMAFFPVLVYFLMGTSRHVSMGTFAVICLMTGKLVIQYGNPEPIDEMSPSESNSSSNSTTNYYSAVQVAGAVSIVSGLWQVVMGVLRLGSLSVVLSEVLVSGFTTGAAIHVFTSQVKNMFGVKIERFNGPLKLIYTYIELFQKIQYSNIAAVIISLITIAVLVINNEIIKPRLTKFMKFPIPIELVVVIIGTLASRYGALENVYNVVVVGNIPTGLPTPNIPVFDLTVQIIGSSLVIAIVAYAISISMAKIFAQKLKYEVDPNQELLAQGASNIFGSFFGCVPIAASLSRSLIQQTVGGKTQLTSIFSCSVLLVVLLWIGPFFETLPDAVLASIIVVALKGMFMQFGDLKTAYKKSTLDAIIWIITFGSVVILDIDYGLGIGVVASLLSIIYINQFPYTCGMGVVPNTDVYLDLSRYTTAQELPGIKIAHYSGGLHFANSENFKLAVAKVTGLSPKKMLSLMRKKKKQEEKAKKAAEAKAKENAAYVGPYTEDECEQKDDNTSNNGAITEVNGNVMHPIKCMEEGSVDVTVQFLILDFTSLSFVDPSGVKVIKSIVEDFSSVNIQTVLAGCSVPVLKMFDKCNLFSTLTESQLFPDVHNAVIHCLQEKSVIPEMNTKF